MEGMEGWIARFHPLAEANNLPGHQPGDEICFIRRRSGERWAESTDSDFFTWCNFNDDGTRRAEAVCITEGQNGYDNNPFYSPDPSFPGLQLHGTEPALRLIAIGSCCMTAESPSKTRELTVGLDQNANHGHWRDDSQSIIFMSEYRGRSTNSSALSLDDSQPQQLTQGPYNWDIVQELAGDRMLVTRTSVLRPAELHLLNLTDQSDVQVTGVNDEIFATLDMPTVKERWVPGNRRQVHPMLGDLSARFRRIQTYPMLTYCQGGPQGQIGQWFSYRWNFHLMAAHGGYVVLAPNRRGLPGFGREWNDQISGDWGGQAMQDLLSATDDMLKEPYVDRDKLAAIGAGFGGYTVYWMMGNHQDRFATMIAHCGVFNLESMYGSTEELFFVNWDMGGPYWRSPEIQKEYNQFSPHRFVQNWKTPLLGISR